MYLKKKCLTKILRKGRGSSSEDGLLWQAKIPAFLQEEEKGIR